MLKPKKHLGGNNKCYTFAACSEMEHAADVVKCNESEPNYINFKKKNHEKEHERRTGNKRQGTGKQN